MPRWAKVVVAPRAPVSRTGRCLVDRRHEVARLRLVLPFVEREAPGGEVVPAGSARGLGVGRHDLDARPDEVVPVADAFRIALPDEEDDRGGVGRGVVRQPLLPVRRELVRRARDRVDVGGERERDDVGRQSVDHGTGLLARAAVRGADHHGLARLLLPGAGELPGQVPVQLAGRVVGDVEQLGLRPGGAGREEKRGDRGARGSGAAGRGGRPRSREQAHERGRQTKLAHGWGSLRGQTGRKNRSCATHRRRLAQHLCVRNCSFYRTVSIIASAGPLYGPEAPDRLELREYSSFCDRPVNRFCCLPRPFRSAFFLACMGAPARSLPAPSAHARPGAGQRRCRSSITKAWAWRRPCAGCSHRCGWSAASSGCACSISSGSAAGQRRAARPAPPGSGLPARRAWPGCRPRRRASRRADRSRASTHARARTGPRTGPAGHPPALSAAAAVRRASGWRNSRARAAPRSRAAPARGRPPDQAAAAKARRTSPSAPAAGSITRRSGRRREHGAKPGRPASSRRRSRPAPARRRCRAGRAGRARSRRC